MPSGAEAERGLAQEARFQARHADAVRHASHALRQAAGSAELYALRWGTGCVPIPAHHSKSPDSCGVCGMRSG